MKPLASEGRKESRVCRDLVLMSPLPGATPLVPTSLVACPPGISSGSSTACASENSKIGQKSTLF